VLHLPGTATDEAAYKPRATVLGDVEKEVILSLRATHRALTELQGLGFKRNQPLEADLLKHVALLKQQRNDALKPARPAPRPTARKLSAVPIPAA